MPIEEQMVILKVTGPMLIPTPVLRRMALREITGVLREMRILSLAGGAIKSGARAKREN